MTKRTLSAEEMRIRGLEMIRKAREKERADKQAVRLKLGELVEKYLGDGSIQEFDVQKFLVEIEKITGQTVT